MAVTFDTSNSGYNGAPSGNNDFAAFMTVGSGSDRALLIGIATSGQTSSFTVTWDQGGTNQNVPAIGSPVNAAAGGVGRVAWFGLVAPTSGSHTLRLVLTGTADEIFVFGLSVTGANQTGGTTTFAHGTSATGNSTTTSRAITSATGNMTVDLSSGPQVLSAPTQAQIFVNNSGSVTSAGASRAAGSASNTHQWTLAGAVEWVVLGIDIVAVSGAGSASISPSISASVSPSVSPSSSLSASQSQTPSASISSSASPSGAGLLIMQRTVWDYVD